ncbi:hypothetical protein WISP_60562 [Willisornis vidua]|uniref:Uncharacterized protein n=1 Tax=Willisornis vidua TaxID=1566151 RepID=A0ABQ9DAS4_9PASS|nr:hypothetical protein WISP_60562 [Willisornis vidua]
MMDPSDPHGFTEFLNRPSQWHLNGTIALSYPQICWFSGGNTEMPFSIQCEAALGLMCPVKTSLQNACGTGMLMVMSFCHENTGGLSKLSLIWALTLPVSNTDSSKDEEIRAFADLSLQGSEKESSNRRELLQMQLVEFKIRNVETMDET